MRISTFPEEQLRFRIIPYSYFLCCRFINVYYLFFYPGGGYKLIVLKDKKYNTDLIMETILSYAPSAKVMHTTMIIIVIITLF